jgi:hypothetical protein
MSAVKEAAEFKPEIVKQATAFCAKDEIDNLCRTLVVTRQLYSLVKGNLQVRLAGKPNATEIERWVMHQAEQLAEAEDSEQTIYANLLYIAAPWLATEIRLGALRRADTLIKEAQTKQK